MKVYFSFLKRDSYFPNVGILAVKTLIENAFD